MNFFFFVTLFVISFQAEKTGAMDIQCEFKNFNAYGYGNKKGCTVQSVTLTSPEDREITSVNGDDGKTYEDVGSFKSYSKTFNNFPQNIKKFFPKVEIVEILSANITTLTKSDMASLGPQLRAFTFTGNNIEVLEEGLFNENPNLSYIALSNNKIKFVASGVFDKPQKLSLMYFHENPCHSAYAADYYPVRTLIKQIEEKCQDRQAYENYKNLFTTTTTTKTTTTTTTTEKVKPEHELRIEELTAEVTELKRHQSASNDQHQEELQKHKAEASLKDAKIEELEKQNEVLKLEAACDKLHEVRDSLMSKLKELEAKFDTTKDMIIKATDAKLDSTDEKCASMNETCVAFDKKLNNLTCIRTP